MNWKPNKKKIHTHIYRSFGKIKSLPWSAIVVLSLLLNASATIISVENIIQQAQSGNNRGEKPEPNITESQESTESPKINYKLRISYLLYWLPITLISMATSIWIVYSLYDSQSYRRSKDVVYSQTPTLSDREQLIPAKEEEVNSTQPISETSESYSLLADMGHELRSPLNAILGFVQIMEQEVSMTPSQRENLAIVNRSGKRLLEIVNDLIDLAKIETDRLRLENNSFDFNGWLDNIEQNIKFQVYERGREFDLIREINLPQYICTDERRLRQILKNLINCCLQSTSASKLTVRVGCRDACPQGAPTKAINSSEFLLEHHIYFTVESQDCFLTSEEIRTLFDPIERVHQEPKLAQTSSLSLPISRQLARLMGGDITVQHQTASDRQLSLCMNIQTKKIVAEHIYIHSTAQRIIGLEPHQPEYRILIVDDSKTNRQLMLQLLEPVGFTLREAANGKEAVEVWLDWQPHMIWMDLRMPVMNGYEATEQIKAYSRHKIPIVAVSASTIEAEKQLFRAAGCDDFVGKPFSDKIIFDKIAQHLGIRYVYESNQLATAECLSSTAEIVEIMPEKWLRRVEQAADELDRDLLTKLLQQIPPEKDWLKNALQRQIDNFDFDRIFTLVSQGKSKNKE